MKINMGYYSALCLFYGVLIMVVCANMVAVKASNEFKVGERGGWREPDVNNTEMYTLWASSNRFRVGDSLYFEYRNDSVLQVEKGGYYHCNATKPIAAFNNGKTTIKLDKSGPYYFISGAPEHCKNGQRLLINVMSLNPPPPSRPSRPSIAVPPGPPQPSSVSDSPAPSPLSNSGFTVSPDVTSLTILVAALTTIASSLL